jgi:hypothetical protein
LVDSAGTETFIPNMNAPMQRLAAQHRRVRDSERMLERLTSIQGRLHIASRSDLGAELLRVNIETASIIARSLELALVGLERERRQLQKARERAMRHHGIPF